MDQPLLLLLLLIVGIFVLGKVLPWADTFTCKLTTLEIWAAQSRWRMFGLPFVLAVIASALGMVTGSGESVRSLFGSGFIGFIFLALFLSGGGVFHVRLGIKLAFMTCVFGVIFSMFIH